MNIEQFLIDYYKATDTVTVNAVELQNTIKTKRKQEKEIQTSNY